MSHGKKRDGFLVRIGSYASIVILAGILGGVFASCRYMGPSRMNSRQLEDRYERIKGDSLDTIKRRLLTGVAIGAALGAGYLIFDRIRMRFK